MILNGENYYNDSVALKHLLEKRYDNKKIQFVPLLEHSQGDKLKSKGIKRLLELNIAKENKKGEIKLIIFFMIWMVFLRNKVRLMITQNGFMG